MPLKVPFTKVHLRRLSGSFQNNSCAAVKVFFGSGQCRGLCVPVPTIALEGNVQKITQTHNHLYKEIEKMSFSLYMVGYIVFIVGLAMAAHLLHVPPRWIGVGVICLAGLGILTGVSSTRHRDPPA